MKLFYAPNSPYARKCRVMVIEKGLEKEVEQINLNPLEDPKALWDVNPMGTVPALVTSDGLHLCDSTVICDYLDRRPSKAASLIPQGDSYICIMAMAALADGIMDAAVTAVMEGRRPPEKQYDVWLKRKEAAVMRGIDKFAPIPLDNSSLSIGTINLAVALAYVSFRHPHLDWRNKHPAMAKWSDTFAQRPSMQATKPAA